MTSVSGCDGSSAPAGRRAQATIQPFAIGTCVEKEIICLGKIKYWWGSSTTQQPCFQLSHCLERETTV